MDVIAVWKQAIVGATRAAFPLQLRAQPRPGHAPGAAQPPRLGPGVLRRDPRHREPRPVLARPPIAARLLHGRARGRGATSARVPHGDLPWPVTTQQAPTP